MFDHMTEVSAAPAPSDAGGARPGRSVWRSVGLPAEHGGWGLTIEPVLLGLLVAPGRAGVAIGIAAVMAFLARTPMKLALGDLRRGRRLQRTAAAATLAVGELVVIAAAVAAAVAWSEGRFWIPLVAVLPLLGTELAYDIRSRGRRLVPELAGSVGIAGVVTMIVLADGRAAAGALALWVVLAARAVTSIPFVREQVRRLHGRGGAGRELYLSDALALLAAVAAALVEPAVAGGSAAVFAVVLLQRASALRPTTRAVVIGVRQMVLGTGVVLATWVGVVVAGGLG